jgi:hypothetical protein
MKNKRIASSIYNRLIEIFFYNGGNRFSSPKNHEDTTTPKFYPLRINDWLLSDQSFEFIVKLAKT